MAHTHSKITVGKNTKDRKKKNRENKSFHLWKAKKRKSRISKKVSSGDPL